MCARETGARAVLRAKASGPKAGSHGRRLCVGEEGHQQKREGDEPEVLRRPLRERPVDASHTRVADANDRPAINRRSQPRVTASGAAHSRSLGSAGGAVFGK